MLSHFIRNGWTVSKVTVLFYILTNSGWKFQLLHLFIRTWSCHSYFNISSGDLVISSRDFNLQIPDNCYYWTSFLVFICCAFVYSGDRCVQIFAFFKIGYLSYFCIVRVLYIFWIQVSYAMFLNIFSQSVILKNIS